MTLTFATGTDCLRLSPDPMGAFKASEPVGDGGNHRLGVGTLPGPQEPLPHMKETEQYPLWIPRDTASLREHFPS